jgi:hypothetical protein
VGSGRLGTPGKAEKHSRLDLGEMLNAPLRNLKDLGCFVARGNRGGRCCALVVTLIRFFGTLKRLFATQKGLCANSGAEHRTFYAAFTVAELGDLLPAGHPSGQDTRTREEFLQYPHLRPLFA